MRRARTMRAIAPRPSSPVASSNDDSVDVVGYGAIPSTNGNTIQTPIIIAVSPAVSVDEDVSIDTHNVLPSTSGTIHQTRYMLADTARVIIDSDDETVCGEVDECQHQSKRHKQALRLELLDEALKGLKCPVCLEIAKRAIETDCCHTIACYECAVRCDSCPICRHWLYFKEALFVRRLINDLPESCMYCNYTGTIGTIATHDSKCPHKTIKCRVNGCTEVLQRKNYVEHFQFKHSDKLMNFFESFMENMNGD